VWGEGGRGVGEEGGRGGREEAWGGVELVDEGRVLVGVGVGEGEGKEKKVVVLPLGLHLLLLLQLRQERRERGGGVHLLVWLCVCVVCVWYERLANNCRSVLLLSELGEPLTDSTRPPAHHQTLPNGTIAWLLSPLFPPHSSGRSLIAGRKSLAVE
jgi:hypothetical protein